MGSLIPTFVLGQLCRKDCFIVAFTFLLRPFFISLSFVCYGLSIRRSQGPAPGIMGQRGCQKGQKEQDVRLMTGSLFLKNIPCIGYGVMRHGGGRELEFQKPNFCSFDFFFFTWAGGQ